jgi:hypothetical protein
MTNIFKKLIFTVLFLPVFAGTLLAGDSYLSVSLYDDSEFYVTFDNTDLSTPGNIAEFDGLEPGDHYLRISRSTVKVPVKNDIIFEGRIKIPAGYNIYAVIDEYNSFSVYKKVPSSKGRCHFDCDYFKHCGGVEKTEHTEHNETNTNNDDCKFRALGEQEFKDFKKTIGSRNFESTNVDVTKSMLDKNMVTTDQLHEILTFFSFESNVLELAKYAYKHTCDNKNYFKIYDLFSFESSVQELKNYISGK